MFDTFTIDGPCPNCTRIATDWQTKQLECLMETWKRGDKIIICDLKGASGYVGVYTRCTGCKSWLQAEVHIDKGVVGNILKIEIEER